MPQTWVAKSGCQVHQWSLFFRKCGTWMGVPVLIGTSMGHFLSLRYIDGPFVSLVHQFSFILVPSWVNFSNRYMYGWSKIVHHGTWMGLDGPDLIYRGTWMGHFSFKIGTWMGDGWWHFKIPRGTPLPRPKLSTPLGSLLHMFYSQVLLEGNWLQRVFFPPNFLP